MAKPSVEGVDRDRFASNPLDATGGAPVLFGTGRQVYNWDATELFSASGRNSFVAACFEGDTHAFDQVCVALS